MQTHNSKKLTCSIRCWVPMCKNRKRNVNVKYFSFPSNPARLCKWLKAVGYRELADLPYKFLITNRYVCQEHFSPDEIQLRQHRVGLVSSAVPRFFHPSVTPLTEDDLEEFKSRLPEDPDQSAPEPLSAPYSARARMQRAVPGCAMTAAHPQEASSPSAATDHTYANSGSSDDEYSVVVTPGEDPNGDAAVQLVSMPAVTKQDDNAVLRRELRRMTRRVQTLQKEVEQLRALTECRDLEVVLTVTCGKCRRSSRVSSPSLPAPAPD